MTRRAHASFVGLWVAIAGGLLLGGCPAELDSHSQFDDCETDADCGDAGMVCQRGFCVFEVGEGEGCIVDGNVFGEGERVSCYTGDEATRDVLPCRPGERECDDGELTSCLGEVLPGTEVCNGVDDDCDGEVDEFNQSLCDTGMDGPCVEGRQECRGDRPACDPVVDPAPEECNGIDDDCDGTVDEPEEVKETPCYPPDTDGCDDNGDGTFSCTGACAPGTAPCVDGEPDLTDCQGATTPIPEDDPDAQLGRDDDCDGEVDEGMDCMAGETCYAGPDDTVFDGTPCERGTLECPGTGPECVGQVLPETEVCNGIDDDCNDIIDDLPEIGDPCTDENADGVCQQGTMQCSGGDSSELVCDTPDSSTEECNDLDDDCDGEVDEDFDLLNDENNCGSCDNQCDPGLTCCDGSCVDLQTSEAACGSCDNPCGEGLTCCSGECADLERSEDHCGACGESCTSSQTCSNSMCCPMGQTNCDGACVDTRTSASHCGSCNEECGSGERCINGCCCQGNQACQC